MKSASIFTIPKDVPNDERLMRRRMLARLGLAWLVMMQVMMFAAPSYFRGDYIDTESLSSLDAAIVVMNWVSFALTMPVLLFCAWPIWQGLLKAEAGHHRRIINMNWPIALGIIVSFIPSVISTLTQTGEVYYDSITMFVAFLLTARYLEFCAAQSVRQVQLSTLEKKLEESRINNNYLSDKVAFYFVFLQICLAVISGIIWFLWINPSHALAVTVSLFVMSCPCAMAMAVPTAYSAAGSVILSFPQLTQQQVDLLLSKTKATARSSLYISLVWHLLMTPLAMVGFVSPWVAALIMFISSMWVAWRAWFLYAQFKKQFQLEYEQAFI